jgi:50S ribosomal protein L16 3-hydroxylase
LPLKILARFEPESEWVLEAGDMLYLPPGVAHDGVAQSECLTWSIGFRAPSDSEIVAGFLDFLGDRLSPPGHYTDAGARAASRPGRIPAALEAHFGRAVRNVRWSRADVREFAGRFLTEPKAQVFFEPPRPPLSRARFARQGARRGVALGPGSRLGFSGTIFFLNGETVSVDASARAAVRRLADRRRLEAPIEAPPAFWDLLHDWYRRGFVVLEREAA